MISIAALNSCSHIFITYDNSVYLFDEPNLKAPSFEYKHEQGLTCGTYLPTKNLVVLTDLSKKLIIIDPTTKETLFTKTLIKRVTKIIYKKNESMLLIFDKTGDVYTFDMQDLVTNQVKLLMGHLSMLTDFRLSTDEKFLITSDRDEKIRISYFTNSYNIKSYLMGHKEFVTQIELVGSAKLISASGDSKLILWDLDLAESIQQIDTQNFIKTVSSQKSEGISKFDYDPDSNRLVIHLFRSQFVLQFKYSNQKNSFEFISALDLGEKIDYFMRVYENNYLFLVLDKNDGHKFCIKKIEDNQLNDLKDDENLQHFQLYLNQNIQLKEDLRDEFEKEYLSFFKNIINNLDEYYERKQERIMSTNAKRVKSIETKTQ